MGQIDGTVARPETCTELRLKSDASKVEVGLDLESVGDFFITLTSSILLGKPKPDFCFHRHSGLPLAFWIDPEHCT